MYTIVHKWKKAILRKNHLIPRHPHCKNIVLVVDHVSRGLENDCIGLCKPLFDIHVATKAQARTVI